MSPPKITLKNGDVYVASVLKVLSRDDHGRPRQCEFLYPEESTHIEGGEEFLIVFAKENTVAPKAKGDA